MPKLKPGTVLPTPGKDAAITAAALADPDAHPLTDAELAGLQPAQKGKFGPPTLRWTGRIAGVIV